MAILELPSQSKYPSARNWQIIFDSCQVGLRLVSGGDRGISISSMFYSAQIDAQIDKQQFVGSN
jgi:hypothetical protein